MGKVVSADMREVRIASFLLLVVLVGAGSLSSAATDVTPAPDSLRTLAPVLEAKLKEWLVAWRAVQPGLKVEQFKKGNTSDVAGPWESVRMDTLLRDPLSALYVSSPDGRWMVNPFGGFFLEKADSHFVINGAPDTFVLLMDRKMSRVRDVADVGTFGGFH